MATLFLVFRGTSTLFSNVAAPIYIPTNSVRGRTVFLFFSPSHIVLGFQILCCLPCTHKLVLSAVMWDPLVFSFLVSLGDVSGHWAITATIMSRVSTQGSIAGIPQGVADLENAANVKWRLCPYYLMKVSLISLKGPWCCLYLIILSLAFPITDAVARPPHQLLNPFCSLLVFTLVHSL